MRDNTNKRTYKWSPAIALLSLLLAVLLAGCGNTSASDGEANQSDQTDEPVAEETTETEAPSEEDLEEEFGEVENPESALEGITEEVTVTNVIDGDTVVVDGENGEETVRLVLVDTPETVHPDETPDEMYGMQSSEFTKIRLEGSTVRLERAEAQNDAHDRTLGYIWMKNGVEHVNFNELLLDEGLARVAYVSEPNTKYLEAFEKAETQAKQEQKNIWSIDGYVTEDGFDTSLVQ